MFEDDYLEGMFSLGKAIELNQKDSVMTEAVVLYEEPDRLFRRSGETALHIAAENGFNDIFVLLWKQIMTNPLRKNERGELPFHYACKEGALEIVKTCVRDVKLSVDIRTPSGWTGLFYAVFNNQIHIVEFLISKRANINSIDKYNRSPLHWAAKYSFVTIAKMLIEAGADLEYKDKEGESALQIINNWQGEQLGEEITIIHQILKKKNEKKTAKRSIKGKLV